MMHRWLAFLCAAAAACTVYTQPAPATAPPPEPAAAEPAEEAALEPGPEGEASDADEAGEPDDGLDIAATAEVATAGLQPASAVSCDGARDVKVVGKTIDTKGNAVLVSGSCTVLIERSQIRAGQIAVNVSGAGDVIIRDSVIEGRIAALVISGAATVRAERTRFVGRRSVSGSGDFVDGGGNSWK